MNTPLPPRPRKVPTQERSQQTVVAILDSCKKILVEEGEDALSPSRLEAVSGVAKGSIYQYFPNMDAIVASMVDREFEQYANKGMQRLKTQLNTNSLERVIEFFVDESVIWYGKMQEVHGDFYERYNLYYNPGNRFAEFFGDFEPVVSQIAPLAERLASTPPLENSRKTVLGMLRLIVWMFADCARFSPARIFDPNLKSQIAKTALTYVLEAPRKEEQ